MARQVYQSVAASDLSGAAAATENVKAPFGGVLHVDECYMRAGEVVGAATTAATVYIKVGSTTVATATPSSTTLDTIGDCQTLTPVSGYTHAEISEGDIITVGHDTQATGGTTTGTVYWHLSIDWGE
jgi:hypothetical protein